MEKANQIQIGMLGVVIVLLLVQMSGVLGGSGSDSNVRSQARQALNTTTPATTNPVTPAPDAPVIPTGPTTSMAFGESTFDFGTVDEGEKVEHVFSFSNSGSEPLTITNAKGSCGCTVPAWPKEPIAPGGSGEIKVVFDSKGKAGKRDQKVTITANTNPAQTIINMVGEVIKDPNSTTATNTPSINVQ